MRMAASNLAQEWMVKGMFEPLSASRVVEANNNFRYTRPDMYLSALRNNAQAYVSSVVGRCHLANTSYYDNANTAWYKLI